MMGSGQRMGKDSRWGAGLEQGWQSYRLALEYLEQADWSQALELLAEAETTFRTADDMQGLWRALCGQALLHRREGALALALARALAALRTATAADDDLAAGCVAWQIANIALAQGDYDKAAEYLGMAQAALARAGIAPPGGALAAAAQLCAEILRWQRVYARQEIGQREVELPIAEACHDLSIRLNDAVAWLRAMSSGAASGSSPELLFLMLDELAPPVLTVYTEPRPTIAARLKGWWRRLHGETLRDHAPPAPAPILLPPPNPIQEEASEMPTLPAAQLPEPAPIAAADDIIALAPVQPAAPEQKHPAPARGAGLAIYCFGSFRVYFNDTLIERWESSRSRALFKYLVTRSATPIPKELLADMLWPDSEPELARRSLHQAIYCLRQTFKRHTPDLQIVQFAGDRYQINQDIMIWIDYEEFSRVIEQARALVGAGKNEPAMQNYAMAIDLYSGIFLEEDRYEGWTEEPRRLYQAMYLEALHRLAHHHIDHGELPAAILLCQRALAEESCDEESHQMLIAGYMAQGLRHLAVRQFQICANALKTELGLAPSEALEAFYRRVLAASP